MALVISRKKNESIRIGNIMVTVAKVSPGKVSLAITAPPETKIRRAELAIQDSKGQGETL